MQNVLSVGEITYRIKGLLEDNFDSVWVKGEIISLSESKVGHFYFNLQDREAKIAVVLFRGVVKNIPFQLENGLEIIIRARISLYPERGVYQLLCDEVLPYGSGSWQLIFEQTKKALEAKGWFDEQYKKPLPLFAKRIALVTSQTGAAQGDILTTIEQRNPFVETILFSVHVQGDLAIREITEALHSIGKDKDKFDLIILARGGGSMEDLFVFNSQEIAKAIFEVPVPLITGIGHEKDFTIADYVADVRASTPTAAAQMAVILQSELKEKINLLTERMKAAFSVIIENRKRSLHLLLQRTHHNIIYKQNTLFQQNRNYLSQLRLQIDKQLTKLVWQLQDNRYQITKNTAKSFLLTCKAKYEASLFHLVSSSKQRLHQKEQAIFTLEQRLYLANPKIKIARDSALVYDADQKQIQSINKIKIKDTLFVHLQDGQMQVTVEKINELTVFNKK